ncbi:MAG: hypothetical protein V4487_03350 [Chlamydiota bacterium]
MLFAHLFLSFCLLLSGSNGLVQNISPIQQSLEIIRSHSLGNAENRLSFLNDELMPLLAEASRLNQEVQSLSNRISSANAEDREQMIDMGEELNDQMALLGQLLPILQAASQIDLDFQQIDAILGKQGSLNPEEEAVVLRLAALCTALHIPG